MIYLNHYWNNIFIFVIASLALVILFLSLFFLFQDSFASLKLFNFKNLLLKTKTKEKRININFHGNLAQLSGYECGFDVFSDARSPFDVHFYIVSILFIIFNLEVDFLFKLDFVVENISNYRTFIIMVFFLLLTLDFIYKWMRGALTWTPAGQILLEKNIKLKRNEITSLFLLDCIFTFLSFTFPFLYISILIYVYKVIKSRISLFYNFVLFVQLKLKVKFLSTNDVFYDLITLIAFLVLSIICRKIYIEIGSLFFSCIVFIITILRLIFLLFLIDLDKVDLKLKYIEEYNIALKNELPKIKIQLILLEAQHKTIKLNKFWDVILYFILSWKLYWLRENIIFINSIVSKNRLYEYLNNVLKIKFLVNVLSNLIIGLCFYFIFFF